MKIRIIILLIAFVSIISACSMIDGSKENKSFQGTVKYVELEGGFYGIVTENGEKYDPLNLPENYQEDGLQVRVEYEFADEQVGFHMWGKIIKITDIQKIK